jgi:hypothetical protein
VELTLELSYRHLPADRQRLLRLIALHPGHDFDAYAVAALAGGQLPTVETELDHLRKDHLLQHATSGRYTMHDLVRAYVTNLAADEDSTLERRAALTRLFDDVLVVVHGQPSTQGIREHRSRARWWSGQPLRRRRGTGRDRDEAGSRDDDRADQCGGVVGRAGRPEVGRTQLGGQR